jgi:hypothetical protein
VAVVPVVGNLRLVPEASQEVGGELLDITADGILGAGFDPDAGDSRRSNVTLSSAASATACARPATPAA